MVVGAAITIASSSCVDEIKFGNAFLEKAPGGTVGRDSVFSNVEYTRQFLVSIYGLQYYGIPYGQSGSQWAAINNPWIGKFDALTDCWQIHWSATALYKQYYSGTHTSSDNGSDKFSYTDNKVWEAVRAVWILLENIDRVPELGDEERRQMKGEAYCLLVARYFDMFRHYGGLPLVTSTLDNTIGNAYQLPRATVEETVKYMLKYLELAIPELPWAYENAAAKTSTGRWTQAGAMALKCKILQFAASPLFNDSKPYAGGSYEAEQKLMTWYGGYKPELWEQCKTACAEFFAALKINGFYDLNRISPDKKSPEAYRQAYRMGYVLLESPEVLHSVRVAGGERPGGDSYYFWHAWCDNGRNSYTPTQEYIEMFSWADGKPFDWDETEREGKLDEMFLKGTFKGSNLQLQDIVLTRDPRLYESARVNGLPKQLSWTTGDMNGNPYELWVGGYDAQNNSKLETGSYATGYDNMKYYLGEEYSRKSTQWVYLRLSDIYLTYAEALLQADDNFTDALYWVNEVRRRVGLKTLEECNPSKNLTSDKQALMDEILRERACELGFEDSRFFDLIRYKLRTRFETPLHGLHIYRLKDGAISEDKWFEGDRNEGIKQPITFKYEKFVLNNRSRVWWNGGFDPKWYLSPFPQTEVNKNYGLVQNPGW